VQDNAIPSGNALAALALLDLSAYTGNTEYRAYAEDMLASIQSLAARYPTGFGQWLIAFDQSAHPAAEVAVITPALDHPQAAAFAAAIWQTWRPGLALAVSAYPPPANAPALLSDRPLVDGLPTAYVCRHFVCQRPTTDAAVLAQQLE
jgi:uncharacterized protein YyaL (SSP411 family)